MLDAWYGATWPTRALWLVIAMGFALFCFGVGKGDIGLQSPITLSIPPLGGSSSNKHAEKKPKPPFEFLLLDSTRVDAYLAQLTNGHESSKHLHQKLVRSASAGISVNGIAEGKVAAEEEDFAEREVTPTAASRLAELERALVKRELLLRDKRVHEFRASTRRSKRGGTAKLEAGDMVEFKAVIRGPRYLEPFLAISHEATVSALLPESTRDRIRRRRIEALRDAVKKFRRQIGLNPRLVLTVHPKQKHSKRRDITVLMPVHMNQLSEERSLLRTDGIFTVVGKVARVFSADPRAITRRDRRNAYLDLATINTWLHPIKNARNELICRANLTCSTRIETLGAEAVKNRLHAIHIARQRMLESLRHESRIGKTGGMLVIPIAIYR